MSYKSIRELLNIHAPPESGDLPVGPVAQVNPSALGPELDDEEFIKQTRGRSIHDPGMKEIFFSNGGKNIVGDYATLAQAFDALRRFKLARMRGDLNTSLRYTRSSRGPSNPVNIFVPGTVADAVAWSQKQRDIEAERDANRKWLTQPLDRRQDKRSA